MHAENKNNQKKKIKNKHHVFDFGQFDFGQLAEVEVAEVKHPPLKHPQTQTPTFGASGPSEILKVATSRVRGGRRLHTNTDFFVCPAPAIFLCCFVSRFHGS